MTLVDDASKLETLAKLARSRAEIRRVLEPSPRVAHESGPRGHDPRQADEDGQYDPHAGVFPRSRTMQLLISGRGIGTVGAVVGGLIMARPALAFKLVRMLPTGAVARMLLLKAVTAFRSKD
jgi:hypothetical protein